MSASARAGKTPSSNGMLATTVNFPFMTTENWTLSGFWYPVLCQNSALLKDHGCNLMHCKVLVSFCQHLMAEAPASPQVDLAALRAGIARHSRMEGFSPPSRVLKALCEQLEDCEVLGGRIVVDKRPRSARELSKHERTMIEVFREHGPVLSYADARQRCIDAGLNGASAVKCWCLPCNPFAC